MTLRRVISGCLTALLVCCCAACSSESASEDVPAPQPVVQTQPQAEPEPKPEPKSEPEPEAEAEPACAPELCEEIWFLGTRVGVYLAQDGTWLRLTDVQSACPAQLAFDPALLESLVCDEQCYVSLSQLIEQLALTWGREAEGLRYLARQQTLGEIPPGYNVPVLMYHAVSDEVWGFQELFVSPSSVEEQLQYLQDNGYQTIWFSDLDHIEDYEKPVILTFDDGYDDNYTELFPLLQQYQAKATIFVIGNAMGNPHKMTREQVHELAVSGLVSIQSHTYSHGNLSAMDEQTLRREMEQANDTLAAVTGQIPYVLCFPEGKYSNLTVQVAQDYYDFSLLMSGAVYQTGADPYRVTRSYIPRSLTLGGFEWSIKPCGKAQ